MKILHLNSNFLYTRIYENLLDNMGGNFEHIIFNPRKIGNKVVVKSKYQVYDPEIINKIDSYLTFHRRNKCLRFLSKNIKIQKEMLIHAHTLSNDGILAYSIFKKYGCNYILTVRNTDVNFTLKYKKHLIPFFKKIIMNARKIIFPNYSYKNKLKSYFKNNKSVINKIENSVVIQNGIETIWLDNIQFTEKKINNEINLLYVGRIYKQKNIHRVLEAIKILNESHNLKINYKVIGEVIDLDYYEKLKLTNEFSYLGTKSKSEIIETMKQCDLFIMPSENETFGLVYIEALSQNLPLIYSQNEGIDGYFKDGSVGKAVNPFDTYSIIDGIRYVIENYDDIQKTLGDKTILENFRWENIGYSYNQLYKEYK